ncbi:ThuA domain-containing protein [Luteolibacter sp. LG18]|uniref:ThuA domain-containing protein n=1 Tax=Luteolibacter sp. LG18 TaxID=2819286 RepID=UPI002B322449|nr:hypothetical protein llg_36970 [Luteolibacter sp. LG18]
MNLPRLLFALFLVIAGICPAWADRIKVLVIEGASNHDWQHRQKILSAILSRDGSFELTFVTTPGAANDPAWATWSPNFAAYNVVLSGYSNGAGGQPRWPATVETALLNYVNGGGGFIAFHEAADSFADWSGYGDLLGLRWSTTTAGKSIVVNANETLQTLQAGQGSYTSHGDRTNVLVKRLGNHPIHAGLPASWMAASLEVWRYCRGPASNTTILSYAKDPETQIQFPVEWTVNYGAGRVYASSYGHVFAGETAPEGMRCAAFQELLVRALKWCAGVNPAATVPADFPTTTAVSIRPNIEGFSGFGGPKAVGAFSNGVLPTLSIVPTGVVVEKAFPALSWDSPIDARAWPGTPGNLLVAEMDGRLYKVADNDSATTRQLVLDITDRVWYLNWDNDNYGEKHGGIFSTVFHPKFGQGLGKDYLYVYYLHNDNDQPNANPPFYDRLARFTWNGTSFTPSSELILIQQYDTTKGHEGGGMAFGADGFLHIAFGDEGTESGDSSPHTQKINDRARSGIWRLDVDMQGGAISHPIRRQPGGSGSYTQGYYVPSSNPWQDATGGTLEEFYAIGLREPHRMSFDTTTGLFWIGDVGASNREEVDVVDAAGLNFQWNYQEGTAAGFRAAPSPLIGTSRGPVYDYSHSVGSCIIGGHVYRGTAIPTLSGKYLFGDNGTQLLYALDYNTATQTVVSVEQFGQGRAGALWDGICSFGVDSHGEPLLLQMGAGVTGGGIISRIKPQGAPGGGTWTYPAKLSQTGVFSNVTTLSPAPGLIPYDVNMPLWSAGMEKKRWVMIPNDGIPNSAAEQITYSENDAWQLPTGTVFVKHFARPDTGAALETRLLVHGTDGWGGVTYKWRADGTDADLLENGGTEQLHIGANTFEYLYPSRVQCNRCHTAAAGPVLGFRTRQLNRDYAYPGGFTANQIESLSVAGYLPQTLTASSLANVLTSAGAHDPTVTDERWVRSYFDSNCSHCHHPGGSSRAYFDARLTTPLVNQSLICGPVIDGLGKPNAAVVKPGNLDSSILFQRMNTIDECCSMPPLAKGIVDQEAVTRVATWILGMDANSCTKTQSFYGGGTLGMPGTTPAGAHGPDGWHSNIVINETSTYTNTTGRAISVVIDRFKFNAGRTGDPVTPFLVKVNGDNNFTVLAIGTTRLVYGLGFNDLPFSDGATVIALQPGDKIATGFLDTYPNGSGGTLAGIIDWRDGGAEIWYGGGDYDNNAGSVTLGQAPLPGANVMTNLHRDYFYTISYLITELQLGNGPAAPAGAAADGANSNLVINESDIFTNTTAVPMIVSVERFRFHASRVTDPLTPFIVRVNADNDFTVLAIGTSRSGYSLGANDLPFSNTPVRISIGPGETVAPGFMDSLPDGTGGTQNGAVSFTYGGDSIFYCYDVTNVGSAITVGQAPVLRGYPLTDQVRSYWFSVSLGFGGQEDEDNDGLPDSWELAFTSSLATLSGTKDSDGDGMSDAMERQAGTNPLDRTSLLMLLDVRPESASQGANVDLRTVPGRSYSVKLSTNLQTWTTVATCKAANWPATTTRITLPPALLPAGADKRLFVRVSPVTGN